MPIAPRHFPDPDLALKTRRSHLALFTIAGFLTIPAGLVFIVLVWVRSEPSSSHESASTLAMIYSAVIPSILGILAWAALGLLFVRPAYPKWHLIAWSLVLIFAISALPACFYWFIAVREAEFLFPVLIFILIAAACCIPVALRNLDLARSSLRRNHASPAGHSPAQPLSD